jgi:hypothetical protein
VKDGHNSKPQGNLRPAITADKPEVHFSRAAAAGVVAPSPYNTAAGPARGGEGDLPATVAQENEEDSDPYNFTTSPDARPIENRTVTVGRIHRKITEIR